MSNLGKSTKEAAIAQMMLKGMTRDQAEEVWGKQDRLKGATAYKEKLKELTDQMRELALGTEEAAIQQLMLDESMTREEATAIVKKTRELTGTKAYKEALKDLNKQMLELVSTGREWQIQQLMIDEGMTRIQAEEIVKRKQQIEALKEYRKQLEDTANKVTDIFMDAIGNLKGGFDNFFKSVVDGFRKMLTDMAIQYIRSQVYKFIFSFLENIGKKKGGTTLGGGGSSGSTSSLASWINIGTSIASAFSGFRAAGGHMNARGLYVVGEHGPEIVVPNTSSHVYSNSESAALISQMSSNRGGTTIHLGGIVINGAQDYDSFKRNQGQMASDLYRMLEKAAKRNR
jgi:hypothetical protein